MVSLQIQCVFDGGTFWVLPHVNLICIFPKVPGHTSFHNLSTIITFAAAPLVSTPFVRNQMTQSRIHPYPYSRFPIQPDSSSEALVLLSGRNRFGSIRLGSGLFEHSSLRFGSVRKSFFPDSTPFGPASGSASRINRSGLVRFGRLNGSVRFLTPFGSL